MEELSDDFGENADRFIVEAIKTGCVWGLEGPDGWALCPSEKYDETDVMPLWSERSLAACHCIEEWSEYQPVAIALDELLDEWLPGMHEDVLLVGINWTADMEGDEWEPMELLDELEQEFPA